MAQFGTFRDTQVHVGDTVGVHYRILEKETVSGKAKREVKEEIRERVQVFEGIVIGIRGRGDDASFTVRRIAAGNIGVERIFPFISPWIQKISVQKRANVRRAKLYFLRTRVGKRAEKLDEIVVSPKTARVKPPLSSSSGAKTKTKTAGVSRPVSRKPVKKTDKASSSPANDTAST